MLFDLGASPNLSRHEVEKKIEELDQLFDLVLIVEHLEESLILMRDLLCWTNDDIVVFMKNARRKRTKLHPTLAAKIRHLNGADQILYEHFLNKHKEAVRRYGETRMQEEVSIFRQKVADFYDICVAEEVSGRDKRLQFKEYSDQVSSFIKFSNASKECDLLTLPELPFVNFVRENQYKAMRSKKRKTTRWVPSSSGHAAPS